jgi:hypothetical protein
MAQTAKSETAAVNNTFLPGDDPMVTVVINNREGLEQVQLQPVGADFRGVAMLGQVVTLLPGLNLVPSSTFAAMMKNPGFAKKFETLIQRSKAPESPERAGRPILEVMRSVGKGGELPAKDTLAATTPDQARAMIEETFSVELLKKWEYSKLPSDEVRGAIAAQIKLMEGAPHDHASAGR